MNDMEHKLWECISPLNKLRIITRRLFDDEDTPDDVREESLAMLKHLDSAYKHLCDAVNELERDNEDETV